MKTASSGRLLEETFFDVRTVLMLSKKSVFRFGCLLLG
jgi:hypothetical protein